MDKKQLIIAAVIVVLVIAVGAYIFVSANTTNTKIELTTNSSLKNGDTIEFNLKDEYRNLLPGESVNVKILDDSGNPTKSVVVTDDAGHGSYQLQYLENGNYTVHITYNGTLMHNPAKKVIDITIDDGY